VATEKRTAREFLHASESNAWSRRERPPTNCMHGDLGNVVWTSNPCVVDWIRFVVRQLCRGCPDPLVFAFIVLWFIYPERRTDRKIPSQTWLLLRPFAMCIASIVLWKRGVTNSNSSVFVLRQASGHTQSKRLHAIEASKIVCVTVVCSKSCGMKAHRLLKVTKQ